MKLIKLSLKNFKGVADFSFAPLGNDASILGDNATGKTTLYDAFLWLLFDKDSTGRKDFNVKTLEPTGEAIHGLEHTVSATLQNGKREIELKKTLTEKWTKRRGEAERLFTGHETSYWIDDVPVKASEYKRAISALVEENLFKIITNPFYFNELPWQERRKILLDICGDVSEDEIIASNPDLAGITEILSGKKIDDYRKIIAEKIRKLNDEIAKVPVRIDELTGTLAGEPTDYQAVEAEITEKKAALDQIERLLVYSSAQGEEYRQKQQAVAQAFGEMEKIRQRISRENEEKAYQHNTEIQRAIDAVNNHRWVFEIAEAARNKILAEIDDLKNQAEGLRVEWNKGNEKTFVEPEATDLNCPTCGQTLPESQREDKITLAREAYQKNKTRTLEAITGRGKEIVTRTTKLNDQALQRDNEMKAAEGALNDNTNKLTALRNAAVPTGAEYTASPEYQAANEKYLKLEAELGATVKEESTEVLGRKKLITEQIEKLNAILNNRAVREKTLARIEELKKEEGKGLAESLRVGMV